MNNSTVLVEWLEKHLVLIPSPSATLPDVQLTSDPWETEGQTHQSTKSIPFIQIFWYLVFTFMLCLAISGNLLIIWIIAANRRMQSVTNYFLFNLSLADLLMASLNGIPNFIYMIHKEWIFGTALCMLNNFMATFTVGSCVFTMTAVSIDRYLAIIKPLKPRMTRGLARRAIAAIWISAFGLALPALIFSDMRLLAIGRNSKGHAVCILQWPDRKDPSESIMDLSYNVSLLLITYVIPMLAMFFCYGAMSRELWRQSQIGESTQRQQESLASKRKIVRMFIVIVTSFGICWCPYHAYFIYQYYDGSIAYEVWAQHLYLSFYWLAMSTAMINPLIYYLMNARFRASIRQTIGTLSCQSGHSGDPPPQFLLLRRPNGEGGGGGTKATMALPTPRPEGSNSSGPPMPHRNSSKRFIY